MARKRKFSLDDLYKQTKQVLLRYGYEGFTFGILAISLDVSRGALYKYFNNKDVLITNYMIHETTQFVERLKEIDTIEDFDEQLDYLLHIILKDTDIHQIRQIAMKLPKTNHKEVEANKTKISRLHQDMYQSLQGFIVKGKSQQKLKQTLPDDLIIGMLFSTIDLPNHHNIPYDEWIMHIKEMICHGIVSK